LPVLGTMVEALRSAGRGPAAQRALQPLAPMRSGAIPAIGAAYGQQQGRRP
jgi:hypothetical protein